MASVETILRRELNLLVTEIRINFNKKNRSATGKTVSQIGSEVDTKGSNVEGIVYAPSHVVQLENGRKPTQGEPTGTSEWYDNPDFENWMRARNIPLEAKYPIFKKIHEKGFKGSPGLISDPVEKSIDRITERVADAMVDNLFKK